MSPLQFATWDFLQCDILTSIDTGEYVESPFKNRSSKCCSSVAYQASNIKAINKSSDHICGYAQAGLSLCISHISHWWKSHVVAHIWTSLMLFIEMLQRAITDSFCFGAKSRGVFCLFVLRRIRKLNSNSQHQEFVIHYIIKESVNLQSIVFKCICLIK